MQDTTEPENLSEFKISVVIPYYNAKDYFQECFDSVYEQSFPPYEIIVVDDASQPEHAQFLDQFETKATIIHLEHNAGAGEARNVGLRAATGNWVAFQDADDLWEANKLEQQVRFLSSNADCAGCHTGVTTFDDTGDKATYCDKPSPLSLADLVKSSHVTPPSFLVRKSILDQLKGFDTNFRCSEDYELTFRIVQAGYQIGFVPEALIRVRRSGHGNLSSNGFRTFKYHVKLVMKHRQAFLAQGGYRVIRHFLAKSLAESGGKMGGLKGRLLYYLGRVLAV